MYVQFQDNVSLFSQLIFFPFQLHLKCPFISRTRKCPSVKNRQTRQKEKSFQQSDGSDQEQCDQIGRFIGLWATFHSLWQQLICPNLPHSLAIFLVKSFLGNCYRHLAIFSGHTDQEQGCPVSKEKVHVSSDKMNFKGSITVQPTSCLFCLESAALHMLI